MMLHKHALQKGKVTSPVISLPLSYRVIDCLLRTADQEKCPPPRKVAALDFKNGRIHERIDALPVGMPLQ